MPGRKFPLVTGEIYHLFNRGVARKPVFTHKRDYEHFIECLWFYHFETVPFKLSRLATLPLTERQELKESLQDEASGVEIYAYCLMPNHYHLFVKQKQDGAISSFIAKVQNSYTKYFNTKKDRTGPLFGGRFHSVRIDTQEQFLHVGRYIHLNPLTSFVVPSMDELEEYPWSSLPEYIGDTEPTYPFVSTDRIMKEFPNAHEYENFIRDQIGYQQTLESIKHLVHE